MKIIGDIRIYKSRIENIEGNSLPSYFETSKILNAKIQRIVMALRENNFSFGDFDHLYINFTTCHVDNDISLAKRKIDRYHPWYRYYDVHISEDLYKKNVKKLKFVKEDVYNYLISLYKYKKGKTENTDFIFM